MARFSNFGSIPLALVAIIPATLAAAPVGSPVSITAQVLVETRKPAADGTVRIVLAPAARVTPGDRLVYQITVQNSGREAALNLVVANPVPAGLIYAGAAAGSPEPELSVDGVRFGTLSQLAVRSEGVSRPALPADVRAVRWRIASIAAGRKAHLSFRATLK
ncbi:MAG: DUF11 domain-containing protein [Sphingomonas sp.]|uniref:hypothetical protein n=1 Tax=Sphingomonas sp. TaxID=28214 RepID=UPI0025D62D88|nr:hypothetical protein [Sphingomonas sp.]MBX3563611.1 DUF11 domain-containing protein [Sphingomonas sp.]